ncbi:hypothetical protein, partial [Sphingobacterium mizutaii]|uniref:hypothetical protein n=1 Tax=Sphingobacterium mizutaii TaxID=1010 RepID=UPI0028AD13A5
QSNSVFARPPGQRAIIAKIMEPQKGLYILKNKRANLFSLSICCHQLQINFIPIFYSQYDPKILNLMTMA